MSTDETSRQECSPAGLNRRRFLQGVAAAGTGVVGATLLGDAFTQAASASPASGGQRLVKSTAVPTGLPWGLYANNPFGTVAEQRVILDAMRRGLNEAPRGATAHLTAYTGIETKLKDDIIAAHRRGVNCRISMDDQMESSSNQHQLARVLGTNRLKRSCFVSLVGTGRARGGNAHGKLFAVDRTGPANKAFTMVGSSNLGTADVIQKWNTMYGAQRARVYEWFAEVHEEMLVDKPLAVPYRKGGPFGRRGRCNTFVYPDAETAWEFDDTYEFFASVDPVGAQVYATQHLWALAGRGKRLAEMLVQFVAGGAQVFVNGGEHFRTSTVDFLLNGGVDAALCGRRGNGRMVWPHCKYWAIVSPVDEYCKVRDGSLNTGSAERGEDFAIEIKGRDAAVAYANHAALVRKVSKARH